MEGRDLILAARRGAGLTQAQLAERMGRRQPTIAAWERGAQRPSFETVAEAVAACGQDLAVHLRKEDDSYELLAHDYLPLTPAERIARLSQSGSGVELLEVLGHLAGARFVLIGKAAGMAHGWPVADDGTPEHPAALEIVPESLEAIADLARERGWRTVPPPRRVIPGLVVRAWACGERTTLVAHDRPRRTAGYRDLARDASVLRLPEEPVQVASLLDLIRVADGDPYSSLSPFVAALWATLKVHRRRTGSEQAAA